MSGNLIGPRVTGSNWTPVVSHDVTHLISGDIDSVRTRLSEALERVGYLVINETPIQGKRSGTTAGANGCSTDILEYPASLTIGLKSAKPGSTRAAFAYEVRHSMGYLSKGDRQTLDRESEAIVAIAHAQTFARSCSACRAELVGAARFCRQCGAPVQNPYSLSELEILKLTAGINAGYKWLVPGAIMLLVAILTPLLLLLGDENSEKYARHLRAMFIVGGTFGATGILMLSLGLWKLRQLLSRRLERETIHFSAPPPATPLNAPTTSELVHHSIVEETTSLLPQENVQNPRS
jgi:hypothetical protein